MHYLLNYWSILNEPHSMSRLSHIGTAIIVGHRREIGPK